MAYLQTRRCQGKLFSHVLKHTQYTLKDILSFSTQLLKVPFEMLKTYHVFSDENNALKISVSIPLTRHLPFEIFV